LRVSRVFVVGSINMDVVATADRHPRSGETVTGEELNLVPGGKGANQAVAAHRAGAETRLVGRLGEDDFGDRLEAFLRDEGLDLDHVERAPKLPTGTALVTVAGSQNTIVVVPGANGALRPSDVQACRSLRGMWLLPSSRCRSRRSRPPFDAAAKRGRRRC
jgi:ribokinase